MCPLTIKLSRVGYRARICKSEMWFIITKSLGENTEDHKIPKRGQNPKRAKSPTEKAKGELKIR